MGFLRLCKKLFSIIVKFMNRFISTVTLGQIDFNLIRFIGLNDASLIDIAARHDVVIMKHCFPASNILADISNPDPLSDRKSLENYKATYRLLRNGFDKCPKNLFIIWTLPPLHRLASNPDNAARATEFSQWLKTDFLTEAGHVPNIYVWDFRDIIMDHDTNFLKYEYEKSHENPDSHPNEAANNATGPQFAQFIVNSIADFTGKKEFKHKANIVFLHHSTGRNVYNYTNLGVSNWIKNYNNAHKTYYNISDVWYPVEGNMPVHYCHKWYSKQQCG